MRATAGRVLALVAGPLLLVRASMARRSRPVRPRIFFGTAPLINMKYHAAAVRLAGYEAVSVAHSVYPIYDRGDFDLLTSDLLGPFGRLPGRVRSLLEPYATLWWALARYDVFVFYANGTILRGTPLRHLELQLLRLGGKKIVMLAYGSDVQAVSRTPNLLFKHALGVDYPELVRRDRAVIERLEYLSDHADWIISGVDWVDYMPRWNELTVGHFALDTDVWRPVPRTRSREDPVVVLHAPNHSAIKGTDLLVEACEALRAEGLPVELRVAQGVPNTEIRRMIAEADIVADQFIVGWYALFAIEGMSMEKPVLVYLRPDLVELYTVFAGFAGCPLVNTHPLEIKERLRELVLDAELRADLGRRSREYSIAHHSLLAVSAVFERALSGVWPSPDAQIGDPR